MTLKYALCPNKLITGIENSYLAKIQSRGSMDLDQIVDRMCYPGSGITKAEVVGVLSEFNRAIESSLHEGYTVNLPFMKIKPSIRGQFKGPDDFFKPKNHKLCFTVSPGQTLKELTKGIRLKKVIKSEKEPAIERVINKLTGEPLEMLKAHLPVEIRGHNFRFPKNDDEVGVFIVSAKQQIRAQIVHCKNTSTVLILLPEELPIGQVRFQITVRYQHHKTTKTCYSLVL